MITRLDKSFKDQLLEFLDLEKELNLFIIGDIENFGFQEELVKYWGQFDVNNKIIAVLMKFYEDFIIYSREDFDAKGFAGIIRNSGFKLLSGKKEVVDKLSKYIKTSAIRNMHFSKLEKLKELPSKDTFSFIKVANIDDAPKIHRLHTFINGQDDSMAFARLKNKLIKNEGRVYYIVGGNGEVICSAETTAENSKSAMIVGVCTHPDHRRNGYATSIVSKLCKDLLEDGKTLCLFYDNVEAGKIYKNIGFEDIGCWSMWKCV